MKVIKSALLVCSFLFSVGFISQIYADNPSKPLAVEITKMQLVGNFVYVNDAPAWHNFDEGRVIYNSTGTYFAETYLKDHLGNIWVAFGGAADAVNSTIKQVNAYYPFGMNIKGLSSNNRSIVVQRNEYQYNGKMYQDEMDLNWYDYGARFYDAVVGR